MTKLAEIIIFIRDKKRLVLEYALIALLLPAAGLTISLWVQNKETTNRLTHTENVLQEVAQQKDILETRVATVEADNRKLIVSVSILATNDNKTQSRLGTLEKNNEAVRYYLNQRLPLELKCLLNPPCPKATNK